MTPNSRLGQYQAIARLGQGGMGEVFRARDTRLNRDVAIKVLPAEFASDRERLRRFDQEARSLAALNHPNVLVIYDTGLEGTVPFLVTELLAGATLREVLNASTRSLPQRKILEYAQQAANGLTAAHSRGIVHRDLKPENIFITSPTQARPK